MIYQFIADILDGLHGITHPYNRIEQYIAEELVNDDIKNAIRQLLA